MSWVLRQQTTSGPRQLGLVEPPSVVTYTGTVADLGFASALSKAAGAYTAPGAPAYNGTVDGLIFASALSTAAGSYAAPGDVPPSALPRYTITAKRRRLEIRA